MPSTAGTASTAELCYQFALSAVVASGSPVLRM